MVHFEKNETELSTVMTLLVTRSVHPSQDPLAVHGQFSLKKLGENNISGSLEVNMFTNQSIVILFNNPKVQVSLAANTFTITGHVETKQLTEMLPSILNQLGADSLTSLKRLAEALLKHSVVGKALLATGEDDDDEVPDPVESLDEVSKNEAN
ncbi:Transcription factor BTF3 [Sciurus carolinensis]|uniref:Transcription factor BTF3 n=1 Tax=Sciurus carolinensis TaxID=30640 RepID=A0AA41MKT2_SCICA|nr:Transcription factor BTF3 [Sciurus carolinensis]